MPIVMNFLYKNNDADDYAVYVMNFLYKNNDADDYAVFVSRPHWFLPQRVNGASGTRSNFNRLLH